MHLLNKMSQHPHTRAICKGGILYSAFKSHLAFKAYLFLKHKAFESFSFIIYMQCCLFHWNNFKLWALFPTWSSRGKMWLFCVRCIHSFLHWPHVACLPCLRHYSKHQDAGVNKTELCPPVAHNLAATHSNYSN